MLTMIQRQWPREQVIGIRKPTPRQSVFAHVVCKMRNELYVMCVVDDECIERELDVTLGCEKSISDTANV
jgi:hypothetical protein